MKNEIKTESELRWWNSLTATQQAAEKRRDAETAAGMSALEPLIHSAATALESESAPGPCSALAAAAQACFDDLLNAGAIKHHHGQEYRRLQAQAEIIAESAPAQAGDFRGGIEAMQQANSAPDLLAERDRLRNALKQIAGSDSFKGGSFTKELQDIARAALAEGGK